MKTFSLAQALSITTGRLCCQIGGVYEILNHATGDNLFTHALPRACRFAAPLLLELYPELAKANTPKNIVRLEELIECAKHRGEPAINGVEMWLKWMREPGECGLPESYDVPCWSDIWLSFDPLAELEGMVGKGKVVAVSAGRAAGAGAGESGASQQSGASSHTNQAHRLNPHNPRL